jgi:hypothetical protein
MPHARSLLLLALVAGLALQLSPGPSASAANPDWTAVAKTFGEQFKAKPGVPLKQKRTAVNTLAKSNDGRAVELLLGVVEDQAKYSGRLRKEWAEGEAAWLEKTTRLEGRVEERRKAARARGETGITVDPEEAEWLGSDKNPNPKMLEVKRQLEAKYKGVVEEESLVDGIVRAIARVLNTLEGEEFDKAAAKASGAASSAKPDRKLTYIRNLGYAKGEKVLAYLESMTKDPSTEIVQTALEAIGRQNSERGADVLIAKLEDARWQVRASAITGLSFYRNGAVVGKVMDSLLERGRKEEGVLQRNFFVAMARIVQETVPATIEAWDSWWRENREAFIKKVSEREGNGLPVEEDPPDQMVETHKGSSSFYGITTNSKHIIYVVDVSGSMLADSKSGRMPAEGATEDPDAKKRIDIAREELKKALAGLSSTDADERGEATFNIVIFSTDVEVYEQGKMVEASKKKKDDAFEWIEKKVVADGNTNIYDALEQAFNIISATKEEKNLRKGADTIFLMTDGMPNRGKFMDQDLIISESKKLNATRKITIHTIGVGEGHDSTFLRNLAAANGGQYMGR